MTQKMKVFKSEVTGNFYKSNNYKSLGNGKYVANSKIKITEKEYYKLLGELNDSIKR